MQLAPYSDSPRLDAELLLSHCTGKSRTFFFTYPEKKLTLDQYQQLEDLVDERIKGMPIAYLTGEKEFWSLTLKVTPDVLIPRADTEVLIETAQHMLEDIKTPTIFDLGTGSGAIALALAVERPDAYIYASDLSEKALLIAKENAKTHNITNITFLQSNWFDSFPEVKAHLIISNPPYIANDCPHIEINVKTFEPTTALFSNKDGYHDLLTIINQSKYYLCRQGDLLLEHGINQEQTLRNTLTNHGFSNIKNHQDIQKLNRCISAKFLLPN